MMKRNPNYTRGYIQEQWNEIAKEIKAGLKESSRDALVEHAEKALNDINSKSTFNDDTGNLRASLMAGYYENGKLKDYVTFKNNSPTPYIVRGAKNVRTRMNGIDITHSSGDVISGHGESMDVLKRLEGSNNLLSGGKYFESSSLVIVAEMFYKYFLENKDGINYIAGFVEYENNFSGAEIDFVRRFREKMRQYKWSNIKHK